MNCRPLWIKASVWDGLLMGSKLGGVGLNVPTIGVGGPEGAAPRAFALPRRLVIRMTRLLPGPGGSIGMLRNVIEFEVV